MTEQDLILTDLDTAEARPGERGLRGGRLGLLDVIAQSIAVMGPALSGGVLTYFAATKAGGATPLAFLLAMVGTLFIGGVVAEFGRQLPSAGSIYTYTATGLSRLAGFVVGWSYSLTFLILAGGGLTGFGYFASTLVQSLTAGRAGGPAVVPWYWFVLAGLVIVAVFSLFDVRISTRALLVVTAASVVVMIAAALIVIGRGSPEGSANAGAHLDLGAFWPGAAGVPWSGVLFGLAFGILSFAGFETGAALAEETADPKRNIPRAVIGSILAVGLFYLLITYATAVGFGVRESATEWPASTAGIVAVTPYTWLGNLVLGAIATSFLLAALGLHTAVSRTVYAMGREAVLPTALGRTHPRWRTPWTAIGVNLALITVIVFGTLALLSPATESTLAAVPAESIDANTGGLAVLAYLLTLGTPAVMFCYLLLGLAGLRHGRQTGHRRLAGFGVIAAATGAVALFGSLYYSFVDGAIFVNRMVPLYVLALVVTGLSVGLWLRTTRRTAWEAMGRIFEEQAP